MLTYRWTKLGGDVAVQYALKRLLASQEQQVVLHMLKVDGRPTKKLENECVIGICYTLQAMTLHKANGGLNDGDGLVARVLAKF